MEISVFNYQDYKAYLSDAIAARPARGRGFKKAIAEAAGCQTGYVSHVLGGNAHFSWEQGEAVSRLLEHSKNERKYFLLLIEFTRAGTPALRSVLAEELAEIRNQHLLIKERVAVKSTLSREDQAIYYSSWHYAAVHMLITLPGLDSKEAIAKYLGLPAQTVGEALTFLVRTGLAKRTSGVYRAGNSEIHLEKDSPFIKKHHTNWRLQSLNAMDRARSEDVHYSAVFTISPEDAKRIREMIVKELEQVVKVVKNSEELKLFCLTTDFFEI